MNIISKNKNILLAGIILWITGVLLWVSGLVVLKQSPASAQQQKTLYNSTWQIHRWLGCPSLANTADGKVLSVGPGQWRVSGLGGTSPFVENWIGSNFVKTTTIEYGADLCGTPQNYLQSQTATSIRNSEGEFEMGGQFSYGRLTRIGGGSNAIVDVRALIPTTWTVRGCIGSGCTDADVGL